jgi:hypothetical protein
MIYWSASNNSTVMTQRRQAYSLRSAILAARSFHANELYLEGKITFYNEEGDIIRTEEKTIQTSHKWLIIGEKKNVKR